MPMETQFHLTDALDTAPRARLLAGASADPEAEMSAGRLHADLYYRLAGVSVHIPALEDRREDIPVLFRHYVSQAAEQAGVDAPAIAPELVSDLLRRDWPGNARALMSEAMRFALGLAEPLEAETGLGLVEQMAQVEKSLLEQALQRVEGRAADAARLLKLPRKTFYDKLTKHGLKPETYRA